MLYVLCFMFNVSWYVILYALGFLFVCYVLYVLCLCLCLCYANVLWFIVDVMLNVFVLRFMVNV